MTSLQPTWRNRHKPWPRKSTWSEYKQHSITLSRPAFGSVTETVNKSVNFKGWASVHRNWAEVTDLSSPVLLTAVFVTTLGHCEPQLEPPQAGSAVSPSSPWLACSFKTYLTDHTSQSLSPGCSVFIFRRPDDHPSTRACFQNSDDLVLSTGRYTHLPSVAAPEAR